MNIAMSIFKLLGSLALFLFGMSMMSENLQKVGVRAEVDVYKGNIHSFDLLTPWTSQARTARRILCEKYREIIYSDQQEEPND